MKICYLKDAIATMTQILRPSDNDGKLVETWPVQFPLIAVLFWEEKQIWAPFLV